MTPQEIYEYKFTWLRSCTSTIAISEGEELDAKRWCRTHLQPHQWHFVSFTDHYEHSIAFEHEEHLKAFEAAFSS
jgi:hypothetical protein